MNRAAAVLVVTTHLRPLGGGIQEATVIRQYWRDPGFWRWWWRERLGGEAKLALALTGAVVLGIGGYLSASA